MHTVALTPTGVAFSWGCNDEGALGREGLEWKPLPMDISQRCNGISLGDSHTILYNTELSNAFFCGLYRNAVQGRVSDPVKKPTMFGSSSFKKGKRTLVKITSGVHHTLALTSDGKVWAWGDAESGKIGRILRSRNKNHQAMKIEQVAAKKARDIFAGNHCSFYVNEAGKAFAFGLNNHGQLGIGYKGESVHLPTPLYWKDQDPERRVKKITGGEHHSICLTETGSVYVWGRNDEGQCGVGDLFGQHQKEKRAKQQAEEEAKAKAAAEAGDQ